MAEEFGIEESPDLLSGEWHPLPDDAFQAERESLGGWSGSVDGDSAESERKTVILALGARVAV